MSKGRWARLVGDLRQLASVRRVVLDDGPETGGALLFSSGSGLDFMVLVDRSLDIGTLNYRGVPLAWQSHAGFRHPATVRAEADGDLDFDRLFSGFLLTCGLEHIRQPKGGSPLHGRLPVTPARLLGYGADWDREQPILFCEGEIIQSRLNGESFLLRRRIESPIGGTSVRIIDQVENLGASPWPQAILYHMNLGYPAVQNGSRVMIGGHELIEPVRLSNEAASPQVVCIRAEDTPTARCTLRTPLPGGALNLTFGFRSETLPYLQVWYDLRPHAGVLSIEPCTSDRAPDGTSLAERDLSPGESRTYVVDIDVSGVPPLWR